MEKEKELKGAFVERDLSWMYFNHRILQEAEKKRSANIGENVVPWHLLE